jgi:Nucleotidyltransferase domain
MPVRSLTSSVFRWPDSATVLAAAQQWAAAEAQRRPDLMGLGIFGSYARGDAGVGSDLDLVSVLRQTRTPALRRAADWDLTSLPVPAEILVYTLEEWARLQRSDRRFARVLAHEMVWLVDRGLTENGATPA